MWLFSAQSRPSLQQERAQIDIENARERNRSIKQLGSALIARFNIDGTPQGAASELFSTEASPNSNAYLITLVSTRTVNTRPKNPLAKSIFNIAAFGPDKAKAAANPDTGPDALYTLNLDIKSGKRQPECSILLPSSSIEFAPLMDDPAAITQLAEAITPTSK